MRPHIGIETLLVYRECPCGEWCATGEGAVATICGVCGKFMYPAGTATVDGVPQFGPESSPNEQRRIRGLGFRAVLANEIALAEGLPVEKAVRLALAWRDLPEPPPYLTPEEAGGVRT